MEFGKDKAGAKSSSVNRFGDHKEEETSVLGGSFPSAFNGHNPLSSYSEVWTGIFLLSSVIAVCVDPLFFYIITVNEDKKCLLLDRKLGITALVLRSFIDFFHILYVGGRLYADFYIPLLYRRDVDRDAWKITKKYLLSCFLLIDILAVLPLPQVLILRITPMMKGSRFLVAMDLLKFFVIVQFVPRFLRLHLLYTRGKEAFSTLAKAAWAKALVNLFLYMLLTHLIGALWYFLAIERGTTCWRAACRNHPGCVSLSFSCDASLGDHTFLNDFCPMSSSNTEHFDFGIYLYALESGIVKVTNFSQKFLHCFRWGIQNLSSCGQNLQTSSYIWENVFAMFITISGLFSFLLLIGNVQIYLQTKRMRKEEKRLEKLEKKLQKLKRWKPFRKLSSKLQKKIINNQKSVTNGLDLEKLHQDLPKELSIKIRRELAFDLLKKVPKFRSSGNKLLDTLCYYLKPVVYSEGSFIFRKGETISRMLFVVQGKLKIEDFSCNTKTERVTGEGYIFGEELPVLRGDSSPSPHILVQVLALTKVEAFALEFEDLKLNLFAMVIQSTWQRFKLSRMVIEAFRRERRLWPRTLGTKHSRSHHAALAEWKPFKMLSSALQFKVEEHLRCERLENKGVDLVMVLDNLPKKLGTQMRSELCFNMLKKVPKFRSMPSKLLGTLCYYLKPAVYSEGSFIFQKGETISRMLFVVEGKLKIEDFACNTKTERVTGEGYIFGEELPVVSGDSSPSPHILVQVLALTKVEAFALECEDLKLNLFAMVIQSTWQRFKLSGIVIEAFRRESRLWPKLLGTNDSRSYHAALEEWKPFNILSSTLQLKVEDYLRYKRLESKGVDLVMLLDILPKKLGTQMKSELWFNLLNKVSSFSVEASSFMGRKLLDALCFCAKPVLFNEDSYLFREGDTIDQMLFVVQGKQRISSTRNDNKVPLKVGNIYGQELAEWVQKPKLLYLPVSSRTIRAITKVEAFALPADDLKRNWEAVQNWAATYSQSTWRRHHPPVSKKASRFITDESNTAKLDASCFPDRSPTLSQPESVITEEQTIDQ